MKPSELLIEGTFSDQVRQNQHMLPQHMIKSLVKQGYKYLDSGMESSVWLAPDGMIYKIMPPRFIKKERIDNLSAGSFDPKDVYLTKAQQSFITWVNYCQKHSNNPFLPYYEGWETHVGALNKTDINPRYYLYIQTRTERLFQIEDYDIGSALVELAIDVEHGANDELILLRLKNKLYRQDSMYELVLHLGQRFTTFCNTIRDIANLAKRNNYTIDLHRHNFMYGSDGEIVINDPWVVDFSSDPANAWDTA